MIKDKNDIINKASFLVSIVPKQKRKEMHVIFKGEEYVIQYASLPIGTGIGFGTKNGKHNIMVLFNERTLPIVKTKGNTESIEKLIHLLTNEHLQKVTERTFLNLDVKEEEIMEEEPIEEEIVLLAEFPGVEIIMIIEEVTSEVETAPSIYPIQEEEKEPTKQEVFVHKLLDLRADYLDLSSQLNDLKYERKANRILKYLKYLEKKKK